MQIEPLYVGAHKGSKTLLPRKRETSKEARDCPELKHPHRGFSGRRGQVVSRTRKDPPWIA